MPRPADPPKISTPSASGPVARWVCAGAAAGTTAFLAGYLFFIDPNNPSNAYPKCPLKLITGIDCPGCGGLRATHAMLHGDIVGAISSNLLAFIIIPFMSYMLLRWVMQQFGKELPRVRSKPFVAWAVPLFLIVFTVVRNIPSTPLYWLNSGA
jgi:hypothetical protein